MAAGLLPTQVVANKGESLSKIITRHYPEADRMVLDAMVLANPEIDSDNVIHPGQVINLPRIDFQEKTVQLKDGLLYALYGSYYAAASWKGDKPWLEKNQVRFLVRVTREASGKTIHRIFLGGYERLEDLREAQERLRIKPRPDRLQRQNIPENITATAGKGKGEAEKPPSPSDRPAAVQVQGEPPPSVLIPPSSFQYPVAPGPTQPSVPAGQACGGWN